MKLRGMSVRSLLDRTNLALTDFSGLLLVLVVILINVEIALRYFAGMSTLIADEYSGYLFTWLSLFGFGYAMQTGQFLHVAAVVERLPAVPRAVADLAGAVAGFVVTAVTAYACMKTFSGSVQFGSRSLQPSATPLWIPQAGMPLALGWLAVLYLKLIFEKGQALLGRRKA